MIDGHDVRSSLSRQKPRLSRFSCEQATPPRWRIDRLDVAKRNGWLRIFLRERGDFRGGNGGFGDISQSEARVQGERTHEDGTILVFVLSRFGSRGEARHWPLALGWVGEDYLHTKPLHWVSEPWCGVPLVDFLACVCPATREATRCHFVARVCTCE